MLVQQAKAAARQWVSEEATTLPDFHGAFFHGSTNWLPDDAAMPPSSDVDIMVVLADADPPVKLGKFIYQGVLLEARTCRSTRSSRPSRFWATITWRAAFGRRASSPTRRASWRGFRRWWRRATRKGGGCARAASTPGIIFCGTFNR